MADGTGHKNRPNTGTVPKIKYSNNAAAIHTSQEQSKGPRMSNNLSPLWHTYVDSSNILQNKRRNQRNKYLSMDVALDGSELPNGLAAYSVNGITPVTSSSNSRRDSVGSTLKCDNVTKYPDRKQIEDKLSQIREYLEVTSSLMTSIRNSDEQIFDIDEKTHLLQMRNDLLDSEKKLVNLLEEIDNSEKMEAAANNTLQGLPNGDNSSENSENGIKIEPDINSYDNEISALREQSQQLLLKQHKAENRFVEARHNQEKILLPHCSNQVNLDHQKLNKNMSLSEFDSAIKDLENRARRLNRSNANQNGGPEKIVTEMQNLHSQLVTLANANNEREELIHVLDNRDAELRLQQAELRNKLLELQTKKEQVDNLVLQLQSFEDEEPNEIGLQVRNIVSMKDQLGKLKEMLDIVNNAENSSAAEVQATANEICLRAENLQNQISKPVHKRNDSYVENRLDNHVSNDTYQKQLNKSQRNQGARPKQRTSSINEKLALKSELEAKKRELEEIMGKHKAGTSNLNHDVIGNPDNDMSWKPSIFCHDQGSDDRLSSNGDENEYSEIQDGGNVIFPQQTNYFQSNLSKRLRDSQSECEIPTERIQSFSRTPERNLRSLSSNTSEFVREQQRLSNKQDKLQKQLELIKTVCDSVLGEIPNNQQQSNFQQVRNNITPSSVYSEQQGPSSTFRTSQNQLNVFNGNGDAPWSHGQSNYNNHNESNNYQNWLTTNTLQTQSFMLNTLNQCCQMLWFQQRELAALRSTVTMLQERLDVHPYPIQAMNDQNMPLNLQVPYPSSVVQNQIPNNNLRPPAPTKTNHQVSAACSMPNLNQYNPAAVASNNDLASFANVAATAAPSGVPNSGLLESCLNNLSQLNTSQSIDHANNVLHAVNSSNLNHQALPAQMWNGQALNNQVAPGNRANNYWDNFRSYSRQNQLSAKNSESGFQNSASGIDRTQNPFPLTAGTSKSNSEHSSTNSQEHTPRKRVLKTTRHNTETASRASEHQAPPPDVLIVNQNRHKLGCDQSEIAGLAQLEQHRNLEELELGLHRLFNISHPRSLIDGAEDDSNGLRTIVPERRQNEWHNEQTSQRPKKNKLVDELRENVYKEVASLISANEARPHFLIQLFKDLKKIESDSLRLKILQSIQNILTQSLPSQQNANPRQLTESDSLTLSESSEQASVWSRPTKQFSSDILNMRLESDEPLLQNSYKELISLLDNTEDEVMGISLLTTIKQVFLESELFKESVKDTVFLKHFSNVLDDVLEQYLGKKVHDIKIHLIQTIGDFLQGELSFIHLIQETIPETRVSQDRKDSIHSNAAYSVASTLFDIPNQDALQNGDNIQNGDLAEADQTRMEENELDEEGAVGGFVESEEDDMKIMSQGHSEEVLNGPSIDFPSSSEGLDQVPTRLQTKIKSGAATPTKELFQMF
ncbi:pericentriolar material 1 protein isoform X2 [Sitophilus oryzae]|uniref:Pericentriolar material 1 protein isoform X2 n=1 Tax=Sitophilus oryzae TaxID=7048 RepID=A0A6J2YDU0_SITOR|nr:pericentriolar material 1 protein isoform X2 [Sitophilus oryzae]